MAELQEQLVSVQIRRTLVEKWVCCIGKALVFLALLLPLFMQSGGGGETIFSTPSQIHVVLLLTILVFVDAVAKGLTCVFCPVVHTLEPGVVSNPVML